MSNAKRLGWPLKEVGEGLYLTEAPGGYHFYLVDKEQPQSGEVFHNTKQHGQEPFLLLWLYLQYSVVVVPLLYSIRL